MCQRLNSSALVLCFILFQLPQEGFVYKFITACLEVLCLLNGVNDQEQSSIKLGICLIRLSKMTDNLYS